MITHLYNPNAFPNTCTNFKQNENQTFKANSQTTSSFQIPEEVDEMNAEGFVNNVNIETQQKVEQFSFDFCSKDVPEKKMDVEGLIKEKSQGLIQEILSSALEKSKSLKQKKMKKLRKNNFDK